ncbi:MAG: PLP-dependent aminotransferase family protein [Clostridia bacterium]|nr:PLP-dependent aminotransferase family protein [Clostridia bacterium]
MEMNFSKKMQNMKPSAIREIFKSLGMPGAISFAAGNPAPESFPVEALSKLAADIFAGDSTNALQYSVTEGYPPLRELVAARLKERFAIDTDNNMTLITSGGQQAIELCCKVMCNEGDVVICENPSFIGALNAFRSLGAKPVGVELEADGISIEGLEAALKANPNARFLYLIPTFHNPAGITMSLEKRRAVYALAQQYDVLILEDNPYGDLRFAGEELPTLKSMDTDGRVLYCSTFSKILSAGMRVGYACGNEELLQKMVIAKQVEDVHTNIFFQMLCAKYMQEYDLEQHIATIRELYRHKCSLMLEMLDKYMPKEVTYTRPEGGLFLWCTLPDSLPLGELINDLKEQGVFVVPGTTFNCDETVPSSSFRLNYSTPSEEQIERGIKTLCETIRKKL